MIETFIWGLNPGCTLKKEVSSMRTILASDFHLGSGMTNHDALLDFLESFPVEPLIIVGDLFESDGGLTRADRMVIRHLQSRPKVIYVAGNHDPIGSGFDAMLGVEAKKKHEWHMHGKKYCAIHGHQFDKWCFIFSERMVDRLFLCLIWVLKKIDIGGYKLANWFDSFHANFAERVKMRAIRYAYRHKIDVIICAHVHRPEISIVRHRGRTTHYYNTGDWVESCSFVSLEKYSPAALYCQRAA